MRHRLVEPALAAFTALLLITAAQAALPPREAAQPLALTKAPAAALAQPAQPVVLVAFAEPVQGYPVVSPFGLRRMPWESHGRLHEGVDIAAPSGHPIRATADGVVTRAGSSPTYGRFVEIQHVEGVVSFYAHMGAVDRAIVSGVAVKAGARIGVIGNSGTSTGPHLHFEIRDSEDRPLNPEAFVGKSFASADDLPISQAARFSRRVRLAHVSRIPENKRLLMQAKLDSKAGKTEAAGDARPETWMDARLEKRDRVRAQIRMIAEEQHRQDAKAAEAAAQAAPSAADAGVPAAAVAPISITPPPLDLNG